MDTTTTYLGLKLPHPLIAGACPVFSELSMARKLEAAGAAALVMYSLFEEQISREEQGSIFYSGLYTNTSADARAKYPKPGDFPRDPKQYVAHVGELKKALKIPGIASLNCSTPGRWVEYARMIQYAGADALELNVYFLATDPEQTGQMVEDNLFKTVEAVRAATTLPLAVKLSPFYSALPNIAARLEQIGANGLVLFNRFYHPDIDVRRKESAHKLSLSPASDSAELLLRLHWIGILSSRSKLSLAVTGGIHSGNDALKAVMAGASGVQMVSSLLSVGPENMTAVLTSLKDWMTRTGCDTLEQMRGAMNLARSADPSAVERAGYMRVLQQWQTDANIPPRH